MILLYNKILCYMNANPICVFVFVLCFYRSSCKQLISIILKTTIIQSNKIRKTTFTYQPAKPDKPFSQCSLADWAKILTADITIKIFIFKESKIYLKEYSSAELNGGFMKVPLRPPIYYIKSTRPKKWQNKILSDL